MIIIGVVLFLLVAGTITTILILKKKKSTTNSDNTSGGGGNQPVNTGCPYNNSNLNAPTSGVISQSGNYNLKWQKNNFPYYFNMFYSSQNDYFISYVASDKTSPTIYYNNITQQLERNYNGKNYYLDIRDPCCGNICGNPSTSKPECISGNLYWTTTSTSKFILTNNSIYSVDAKAYIILNTGNCTQYTNITSGCSTSEGDCSDIYSLKFSTDLTEANNWVIA